MCNAEKFIVSAIDKLNDARKMSPRPKGFSQRAADRMLRSNLKDAVSMIKMAMNKSLIQSASKKEKPAY